MLVVMIICSTCNVLFVKDTALHSSFEFYSDNFSQVEQFCNQMTQSSILWLEGYIQRSFHVKLKLVQ